MRSIKTDSEWVPSPPPVLDILMEWCSENAEQAVAECVESIEIGWDFDSGAPLIDVCSDVEYVRDDGVIDVRCVQFTVDSLLPGEREFDHADELKIADALEAIASALRARCAA